MRGRRVLADASTPTYRIVRNLGAGTDAHSRVRSESGSRSTAKVPAEKRFFSATRTRPCGPCTTRSRRERRAEHILEESFPPPLVHRPGTCCGVQREASSSYRQVPVEVPLVAERRQSASTPPRTRRWCHPRRGRRRELGQKLRHTGHLGGLEPRQRMDHDLALAVFVKDAVEEDRMNVRGGRNEARALLDALARDE